MFGLPLCVCIRLFVCMSPWWS